MRIGVCPAPPTLFKSARRARNAGYQTYSKTGKEAIDDITKNIDDTLAATPEGTVRSMGETSGAKLMRALEAIGRFFSGG